MVILCPRSTLALINIIKMNGKKPLILKSDRINVPSLKAGFYLKIINNA